MYVSVCLQNTRINTGNNLPKWHSKLNKFHTDITAKICIYTNKEKHNSYRFNYLILEEQKKPLTIKDKWSYFMCSIQYVLCIHSYVHIYMYVDTYV